MRSLGKWVCAMSVVSLTLFAAIGYGMNEAPAPIDSTPGSFDRDLIVNEIPTHIREWRLNLGMEESADFYRRYLGEHHVEFKVDRGLVLAAPRAQRFVTVELQSLNSRVTRARVSEANLSDAGRGTSAVPLPPDAQLLTRVGTRDGESSTQSIMAHSPVGLGPNADFFKRRLSTLGLRLTDRHVVDADGRQGEILAFTGPTRSVEIVMTRERGRTWISVISTGSKP